MRDYQLYTLTHFKVKQQLEVRKDINEHERLSNFTLQVQQLLFYLSQSEYGLQH